MIDWLNAAATMRARGETGVLVTVVDVRGSTPRELGAKMLVGDDGTTATIGGGQLEYRCQEIALELLRDGRESGTEHFSLGPSLGQCCGGTASVAFERIDAGSEWVSQAEALHRAGRHFVLVGPAWDEEGRCPVPTSLVATGGEVASGQPMPPKPLIDRALALLQSSVDAETRESEGPRGEPIKILIQALHASDFQIVLFGAGHVGKALVRALGEVPCTIRWIDSRADVFPVELPPNVETVCVPSPELEVDAIPAGAYCLIMTHSHGLDQLLCECILERNDFDYCGLIGSMSKRRQFEKRFRAAGIPEQAIGRLTCPIGTPGITGKHPGEIAIAVAAQVLQERERRKAGDATFAHNLAAVP